MYRQGDVLLIKRQIPKNAKKQPKGNRIVLMEGEATGHAHALYEPDKADVYAANDEVYLRVIAPTALRHEEHAPITLPAGDYLYVGQFEYTPKEIRRVLD